MRGFLPFRVRVRKLMETWVDIEATSATEAERQAMMLPGVVSVFDFSAIPTDKPVNSATPDVGIEEGEADDYRGA